jgi:hypothetical protein
VGGNYKETRELDGIPEPLKKVTVLGGAGYRFGKTKFLNSSNV